MATIDEVAPDLYRASIYVPQIDLQFNHFLIRDEEPLLFHSGTRRMFSEVRDAVAKVIDLQTLRWIGWSHFEVDECGALNEWLAVAPRAQAICSQVGALVNIEDFADRPPRGLSKDEIIDTGQHQYRFVPTPHLPHGWDAGVLFEEKSGVRLCSDLFHQVGNVEPTGRAWSRACLRDSRMSTCRCSSSASGGSKSWVSPRVSRWDTGYPRAAAWCSRDFSAPRVERPRGSSHCW